MFAISMFGACALCVSAHTSKTRNPPRYTASGGYFAVIFGGALCHTKNTPLCSYVAWFGAACKGA